MKHTLSLTLFLYFLFSNGCPIAAGYRAHRNDQDMAAFLEAYPACKGGRIDSCLLCHPAGTVEGKHGSKRSVDSCTYCHDVYGLTPPHGPLPLNSYGRIWMKAGRNIAAFRRIALTDPDGDGVATWKEIGRESFPGDAKDHPGLLHPPTVTLKREQLAKLPRTSFTLLMNTHKSGDFYATYGGVTVETLLKHVGLSPKARSVTFFCPDGYCYTVLLRSKTGYHLLGSYPKMRMYHGLPWVKVPKYLFWLGNGKLLPGTPYALLAMSRNSKTLKVSNLVRKSPTSRRWILNGEGPYRLVLPQANPCIPDQPSNRVYPDYPNPFNNSLDHNNGPSVRTVVALRVDPLPEGTTDSDWHRRGWKLVEEGAVVIYGAISR